jgi:hypothetical protein
VQGRLRKEPLSVVIETECKHCGQPLHLHADSAGKISIREAGAQPWVFMPDVEWSSFAERTIIDAY